jgi:hypothetical protein
MEAQQEVEFSGLTWLIQGEAKIDAHMGQQSLLMRSASAILKDSDLENFTIEYDIAVKGPRSFVGVAFRADTLGGYEDFYIRPHQTGRFDAIQYTPVYHGVSGWQLYPEGNATLDIPRDQWLHVKLVISGSRMEAYIDGQSEPAIVVDELVRGRSRGLLALKSNFPAEGHPADFFPTAFANVVIQSSDELAGYTAAAPPPPETGFITNWDLSPAYAASLGVIEAVPADWIASDGWETVETDSKGRVNIARYRVLPREGGTVLMRATIHSAGEQSKRLNFGASDRVSVFLNGKVLFTGDNTYRSRSLRYLGVMTIDNDALFLPLQQGENELLFAVSEAFGGWGVTARFEDLAGIELKTGRN